MFVNRKKKIKNKQQKILKKNGRGVPYIYNNRVYFRKKNTKRNWSSFTSRKTSFKRRWRRYWNLMVKKKYVWFINRKKSKRKNKKNIRQKKTKVLVKDLSYYIHQENSGIIQCDESKKKLCYGKTKCT